MIGFVSFKIPSDSMEPALFAGDNILVNKWGDGRTSYLTFRDASGEKECRNIPFARLREGKAQ